MHNILKSIFNFLILSLFLALSACAEETSIYKDLAPEEDGVISVEVPDDNSEPPPEELVRGINIPTEKESEIIEKWHDGEFDKLSFLVVDAQDKTIKKSYYADVPRRLASVSKISTALGALHNVRNVEVHKVQDMLKISNNGEASRYVRLGAKALDGYETPTKHYGAAHSCPGEFLNDEPAATIVFDWLKSELNDVDWTNAGLFDGAGCHYENFMNSYQTAHILAYADSMDTAYDGLRFEDLLSINGVDGTWKNKNLDNKGYIFAKTGTLNPNANLAGYFYARRNNLFHRYYFTVFVEKKGGGNYSIRARRLIEELLRYWIKYYSTHQGASLGDFQQ